MVRFRKVALFGLLIVMLGMVGACGSSSSNNATGPKSLIDQIKARGELRLGVATAQPWTMKDAKTGEWEGVYVDVMADFATTLNVKFTPVATTWDSIVAGLQSGQFDIAADLNARPARAIAVTFSNPMETDMGSFAVLPARDAITTFDALNSASNTVCVMQGTAEDLALSSSLIWKAQITRLADEDSCRLALQAGRVKAFYDDWNGNGPYAAANSGTSLIFPPQPFEVEGICYAIDRGYSYDDMAAINIQIQSYASRGLLAKSLAKWGAVDPVKYAAVAAEVPVYVKTAEAAQFPGQ
jgi:polar amino acid transport system substrate-binding protein